MPIYEYRCAKCGMAFEKLMTNPATVVCPACGDSEVSRTFSVFGLKTGATFVPSTGGGCGCSPSTCGCH